MLQAFLISVGVKGFEPSTSNSRSWHANRTALHPEKKYLHLFVDKDTCFL